MESRFLPFGDGDFLTPQCGKEIKIEKWILAVGYDKDKFAEAQVEWLNYHVFIRMADNIQDAVMELSRNRDYLLVAIFSDNTDYLAYIKIIRSLTNAPILVMKHQYDGAEKYDGKESGMALLPDSTERRGSD